MKSNALPTRVLNGMKMSTFGFLPEDQPFFFLQETNGETSRVTRKIRNRQPDGQADKSISESDMIMTFARYHIMTTIASVESERRVRLTENPPFCASCPAIMILGTQAHVSFDEINSLTPSHAYFVPIFELLHVAIWGVLKRGNFRLL